ncbi:hypothetical protein DMB42_11610 [Nonomuraea sp. WAC 01424]|uniref:hypothetical protein n=1 Tax=Nonomuraea sp. WAC 01424 TaxID=2203200 RepID=UPI000F7ABDF5|nr:hypothetical protein [Nonomuraea sp. WAC 01424]RSN12818.1 hypothetical protein DMB42_11610 [Nonomuraea sp. WAC 01424]
MDEFIAWIKQFDIDFGDAPAWAALLISIWVWFSSRRWQRKNSSIAERSARATEDAAEATKVSADAAVRSANAAEKATALAELASQPPPPPAAKVSWRIQLVQNALYRLRNTGDASASKVNVDKALTSGIVEGLPQDAAVRAGGSVEFYIIDVSEEPFPGEIWLTWEGQSEPVPVAVPQ